MRLMPTGRKNERYNEFSLESHYCNTVSLWGTTLILVTAFFKSTLNQRQWKNNCIRYEHNFFELQLFTLQ